MKRTSTVRAGRTVRKGLWLAAALGVSLNLAQAANVKHIEQDDPAITYTGVWSTGTAAAPACGGLTAPAGYSNGSANCSDTGTAQAVLHFNGTGITWIGVRAPTAGIALVYIDGALNTVDGYSPSATPLYQQPMFTARGLHPGQHTLSIEVKGSGDTNGSGSWVWIDGFDIENGQEVKGQITATAGLAEYDNPAVTYTGNWYPRMGGTAVEADDAGDRATITFTGNTIAWIGYRDQYSGWANVYVDGTKTATIDTSSPTPQAQAAIYFITNLGHDPKQTHTLSIEVEGTPGAFSTEAWVWVEAFNISFQK